MRTIEHKGIEVTYNELCGYNWRWQKAIVSSDIARSARAIERLLCGHDDYYAYALANEDHVSIAQWDALTDDQKDDLLDGAQDVGEIMNELLTAVMQDMEQLAKN